MRITKKTQEMDTIGSVDMAHNYTQKQKEAEYDQMTMERRGFDSVLEKCRLSDWLKIYF